MRMTRNRSGHTVRPASSWRSQKLLYVAVFAVAGVVVYRWGVAAADRAEPSRRHTATATIYLPSGSQVAVDPEKIRRQITAKANVDQALRRLGSAGPSAPDGDPQAASRAVERVIEKLHVTGERTAAPGRLAVSITYTDQAADHAARLVNELAESFAEDHRAGWRARARRARVAAQQASDRAQREFIQARARLDAFCRQQFEKLQAGQPADPIVLPQQPGENGQAESPAVSAGNGDARAGEGPDEQAALVENPAWRDLSQQLVTLKRHRQELLVDRTRLHPEVQDTELRIAALKEQLSATPRQIPGTRPGRPGPGSEAPVGQRHGERQPGGADPAAGRPTPMRPSPVGQNRADRLQRFQALKQEADRAADAYFGAIRQERRACRERHQEPRVELDLAQPSRPPAAPGRRLAPALAALAAGLAVAVGVGMISAGAAIEPVLNTVEQAQELLPAPVVGVVPETAPAGGAERSRRWRPLMRPALIAAGLILIVGCVALLLRAWAG